MPEPSVRTPILVPYGADETVYIVVDLMVRQGGILRETRVERTDIETIIAELMSGRFNEPVRVIAFNTLEHWADDISAQIAAEIEARCDIEGTGIPEHIRDFVVSATGPARTKTYWSEAAPGSRRQDASNKELAHLF
jgi:hypothetical protein